MSVLQQAVRRTPYAAPRPVATRPAPHVIGWTPVHLAPSSRPQAVSLPAAPSPGVAGPVKTLGRQTRHNAGAFSISLPDTWKVVAEHAVVLGRTMRLVARSTDIRGIDGGLMVYSLRQERQSLAEIADAERTTWSDLFVDHGYQVSFVGHTFDKSGAPTGFTLLRQRDGQAYYDTTLIVRDRLITYGVRVYTRVGDAAMATDLQIARSFVVNA